MYHHLRLKLIKLMTIHPPHLQHNNDKQGMNHQTMQIDKHNEMYVDIMLLIILMLNCQNAQGILDM